VTLVLNFLYLHVCIYMIYLRMYMHIYMRKDSAHEWSLHDAARDVGVESLLLTYVYV